MRAVKRPDKVAITTPDVRTETVAASEAERYNVSILLEQAPAFIAILRGPEGIVEVFNAAFRKLWGDREVIGLPMRKAWPELEGQGYFEIVEKVLKTGEAVSGKEFPGRIDRHNNGILEQAYFNFVYAPYRDHAGNIAGVMIHGTEVTAQVLARQKAEASEERLQLALTASRMGTWEWNVEKGELTWSQELKKIWGLPIDEEITYEKYISLIHPDDRKRQQETIKQAMESGQGYKNQHRIIWPDGSVHWVLAQGRAFLKDGKVFRMLGTSMNIDELKETEMRMQESEQRFREMADTAPVLIWISDTNKLCIYFNKPWLEYTGRKIEQELGMGWAQGVHPDDLERCMRTYTESFDAREQFRMEYRLRRHDGSYHWVVDTARPRFSIDGEFLGYIGSCTDIEEIKRGRELERMNAMLKKQRTQLVALNRAKDEFISIASHQLRTPASAVKQYVGMLMEGYVGELSEMQSKMIRAAYDSNERQLSIVEDLLRVAQVDAGKIRLVKTSCDITSLLDAVVEEQRSKFATRKQRLYYHSHEQPLKATVDQRLLRMVLENIIDNASKYTPQGKPITISLKRQKECIILSVKDRGVGIGAKDQKKLFQKFSRLSNPLSSLVSGTGLGLYWAKKIIDLHEGSITVESQEGKGSTFTISLPAD